MSSENVPDAVGSLIARLFCEKASWEELIKAIRREASVDLLTATRMALSHPGWRRFGNDRINSDPKCRKQALAHMHIHGFEALIAWRAASLRVIQPGDGEQAASITSE